MSSKGLERWALTFWPIYLGTGEDVIRLALARRIGEALAPRRGRDSECDADKDPHGVLEDLLKEFWGELAVML